MIRTIAKRTGVASLVVGSALLLGYSASAAPVSYERLLEAQSEPHNWLLPYGSYNNANHSNLSQINTSNVGNLQVKFLHSIGGADFQTDARFQMSPVVNDGFMYIANPWGETFKFDVRTGTKATTLWINESEPEEGTRMRGSVALLEDYIYMFPAQYDMRMLKIDAESGETVWEVSTLLPEEEAARLDQRQTINPLAVKDTLIGATTGTTRRNAVSGYSAEDGALKWRFYTIPGPGDPGHETWAGDWDSWLTGGAAVWTQGAFDPETNLYYVGTGEPSPWYDPEFRPGDNLYTVTNLAIDVDTGELAWYFQEIPDESWDYDTVNPKMLYDLTAGGVTTAVQGHFSRNGYYYTLDRANGDFIGAEAYTAVNWTAGIDPKTGMPVEYDPNVLVQTYAPGKSMIAGDPTSSMNVCPYFYGMPTLMPATYDAARQAAYIGAQAGCFSQTLDAPYPHESFVGKSSFGGERDRWINGQTAGTIWAVDTTTGQLINKVKVPYSIYSGTLGTSGGLLFTAQLDGRISAFDKDTLAELWAFNAGTPVSSPPISYSIDGKQYIAILTGGQDQSAMAGRDELKLFKRSPSIIVFGL
jgi:alcohol dehydrogenase (cytochrome c)